MGSLSGFAIAFVIHSVDHSVINRGKMPLPPGGNMEWWAGESDGTSIAFAVRSVDHSLSIRLIPPYISLAVRSVERSLWEFYQDLLSYSLFTRLIAP